MQYGKFKAEDYTVMVLAFFLVCAIGIVSDSCSASWDRLGSSEVDPMSPTEAGLPDKVARAASPHFTLSLVSARRNHGMTCTVVSPSPVTLGTLTKVVCLR